MKKNKILAVVILVIYVIVLVALTKEWGLSTSQYLILYFLSVAGFSGFWIAWLYKK